METKILKINDPDKQIGKVREVASALALGLIAAVPTETVYGLAANAKDPSAVAEVFRVKGRPQDNPLIVHISSMDELKNVAVDVPREAYILAEKFWPGPLTMILHKSELVPKETTGGLDTVAVRFPSDKIAQKLIEYSGGYIAAPSANLSGRPSPTVAKYVSEDMNGRIEMIIDGGAVGIGLESTIIDLTVSPPQILRPGYVTEEMLREVLGRVDTDVTILRADSGQAPKAPGMKYRHYAPKGELTIVEGEPDEVVAYINGQVRKARENGEKTGVIGTDECAGRYCADVVKSVGSREDEESIARHLFTALREFDDENVERMYSEGFDSAGLGQAIMNRLLKAAGHHVVRLNTSIDTGGAK